MSRVWNAIHDVSEVAESSPITEPVTLEEAKDYMRLEGFQDVDDSSPVEFDDDDDLIESIITSSREAVEKYCGLSLVSKTLTVLLTNKAGMIQLPYGPVVSVTQLTEEDGTEIEAENYTVLGTHHKYLKSPLYENMYITYTAGYDVDECPESLKQAILIEVLYRYENRGDIENEGLSRAARIKAKPFKQTVWLA